MPTAVVAEELHSLADFQRNPSEYLDRVRETREPLFLMANGKSEIVLMDAESYQRMIDAIDYVEAVEGIHRGLESLRNGKGVPAEQVLAELRQILNIPEKP